MKEELEIKTVSDGAFQKMHDLLFQHGIQTTLGALIQALKELMKARGYSTEGVMVVEGLKEILNGYLRRYEEYEQEIGKD